MCAPLLDQYPVDPHMAFGTDHGRQEVVLGYTLGTLPQLFNSWQVCTYWSIKFLYCEVAPAPGAVASAPGF